MTPQRWCNESARAHVRWLYHRAGGTMVALIRLSFSPPFLFSHSHSHSHSHRHSRSHSHSLGSVRVRTGRVLCVHVHVKHTICTRFDPHGSWQLAVGDEHTCGLPAQHALVLLLSNTPHPFRGCHSFPGGIRTHPQQPGQQRAYRPLLLLPNLASGLVVVPTARAAAPTLHPSLLRPPRRRTRQPAPISPR